MARFIDRYRKGEYEKVWEELLELGSTIRQEPLYADALAVVRETMARVKYNIELLIPRLDSLGYHFGDYRNGHHKVEGYSKPHHLPPIGIEDKISRYEELEGIGVFPLSIRAFWEIVGDIDLTGWHPSLTSYSDPLVVFPIEAIDSNYATWRSQIDEGEFELESYKVPIAPDYFHKDNVSGGEGYLIKVPNNSIDGLIENEQHNTTFVNYLRLSFRYGGFPGLQFQPDSIPVVIRELADGLMPI